MTTSEVVVHIVGRTGDNDNTRVLCGAAESIKAAVSKGLSITPVRNVTRAEHRGGICSGCRGLLHKAQAPSVVNNSGIEQREFADALIDKLEDGIVKEGLSRYESLSSAAQLAVWEMSAEKPIETDCPVGTLASRGRYTMRRVYRHSVTHPVESWCGPSNRREQRYLAARLLEKLAGVITYTTFAEYEQSMRDERAQLTED